MKILFLHGWKSSPGGRKPSFLEVHGHEVLNPLLDDEDFARAVSVAQEILDAAQPDVIVGSSRGGAVAMNLETRRTPLVLLCPAWKRWGVAARVPEPTWILHSRQDEVIPFADSEELLRRSGIVADRLIEVGEDHRLADPEPLRRMLEACELATGRRASGNA